MSLPNQKLVTLAVSGGSSLVTQEPGPVSVVRSVERMGAGELNRAIGRLNVTSIPEGGI